MITWKEKVIEPQAKFVLDGEPKRLFELLGTIAFLSQIRQPGCGQTGDFDREATAATIGYQVEYLNIRAAGGFNSERRLVLVQKMQSSYQRDLTVGHEIAHLFIDGKEQSQSCPLSREDEENFCEYFAHRLVDCDIPGQLALFEERISAKTEERCNG